jgi:hypothetical protein
MGAPTSNCIPALRPGSLWQKALTQISAASRLPAGKLPISDFETLAIPEQVVPASFKTLPQFSIISIPQLIRIPSKVLS